MLELEDLLPEAVRHDGIRLDPDQGHDRHLGLRLHGRGPAEGAVRALQHPGREIDLQHPDAAADHRHHALQGLAPVRRADAHRARGARAAPAGADARRFPPFTKLRFLPRDAYYCGGELVPVFDERERVNRAPRRARRRRPDRALPAGHPGAGAGAADHRRDRRLPRRPAALATSAWRCTAWCTRATCPASACCKPREEQGPGAASPRARPASLSDRPNPAPLRTVPSRFAFSTNALA